MRKRKVTLSEELFDKYQDRYYEQVDTNKKLQYENGYLKALFDKEGDTQVIKYNGKLFRIINAQHCKGDGEEVLDISLIPVSEVG